MLGFVKIEIARKILDIKLHEVITNVIFDNQIPKISIALRNGMKIFLRYNNYNQYSYTIYFSESELDRCRFDNYDERWEVQTKPHHFHPRSSKNAFKSPMNGNPEQDILKLCDLVIEGKLYISETRF